VLDFGTGGAASLFIHAPPAADVARCATRGCFRCVRSRCPTVF
jgi:hypothetical protein